MRQHMDEIDASLEEEKEAKEDENATLRSELEVYLKAK